MNHIIPHRIHAEKVNQVVHIDHITLGLAHLAPIHHQPGMAEYLLRQRLSQSHQENGPVNGMEADNVFADQVQIRRPQLLVLLRAVSVRVITDARDIIGQCVQPHIYHMLIVKVHRNPPLKRSAGHAQILQARQQEIVHHLVFAGHGLNKFRMAVDMLDQPVSIFTHTEKICFFLGRLNPAAVGTLALHQLGFGPERLAGRTIQPLIGPLVDIPLVIQTLENLLHLFLMGLIRGADELVILNIQLIAEPPDHPCHIVHKGLGSYARLLGLQFDLLPVFIRSGLEKHIIPLFSLKAGDGIRQHNLVIVANMRLTGCISDGSCNVIRCLTHIFTSSYDLPIPFFTCSNVPMPQVIGYAVKNVYGITKGPPPHAKNA